MVDKQPRMRERERERKLRYTAYRPCQVLGSPPGNRTGQIYRWNIKTSTEESTQKIKPKVINKRCIYMQMFRDYYAQKNKKIIHRHILLLDIRLWLEVAFHFFFQTIFLNVFLSHKSLSAVLWRMSSVKMWRLNQNSG